MVLWEIVALVSGVISIGLALVLFRWVLQQKNESEKMKWFSERIQEGAAAYLKRLYQALGGLAVVITDHPSRACRGLEERGRLYRRRGLLGGGWLCGHVRLDPRQCPRGLGGRDGPRKGLPGGLLRRCA